MQENSASGNNKKKITDLIFNISAIVIMNCVLQFLLYPSFERQLGEEKYGIILSLLSIISITAGSCGTSANYSRLINVNERKISNGDYFVMLLISGFICSIVGVFALWYLELLNFPSAIFLVLLMFLTTFRYYADVEYKEKTKFLYYFLFYLCVSVGYVLGMFIFKGTGSWLIAIACGELLGIAFSVFASKVFLNPFKLSVNFKVVAKSFSFLVLANIFESLTLHADRLILVTILGGEEVTVYYVASLFGKVVAMLSTPFNSVIIAYLIKYKGDLNKKLWSLFVFGSLIFGAICFAGCLVASIIITPYLYPDVFDEARIYLVGAMISQVMYFISTVLLVVLLRFKGEKKQFYVNLVFTIGFFGLSILGSVLWGLKGFVYLSMLANIIRFTFIAIWGYIPTKKVEGGTNVESEKNCEEPVIEKTEDSLSKEEVNNPLSE